MLINSAQFLHYSALLGLALIGKFMSTQSTTISPETANFASLNLSDKLLKALADMNFETPSPVQSQTIPVLLNGQDVIAQAQTGTGKTAAFALPILHKLNTNSNATQALIIAPTRELAMQIAVQFEALSTYSKATISVLCGGQDYAKQLKQLREGAQIVVGTPGRILDHIERNTLKLDQLVTFVLDEADEMLRMGFIDDVEMILSKIPEAKQCALFSATMPTQIRKIANKYLRNPVSVEIKSETATVLSITQRYLVVAPQLKPDALLRVLAVENYQGVIVFVRTKVSAEEVAGILQQQSYRAMAIHGDITQAQREHVIAQFRLGAIDILVATDVAARGLDVDRVTHVINYDTAHDCETYVHRIGRTGRAGRSGTAILFMAPRESRVLSLIERHTRQRIEKISVPNDHMIISARQQRFMADISTRLEHEHINAYQKLVNDYMAENTSASAIDVAAALALLLNKDKSWQQVSLPKVVVKAKEGRVRDADNHRNQKGSFERSRTTEKKPFRTANAARQNYDDNQQDTYRLDVGRVHGVKPGNIVGAIANEAGLASRNITGLKINDDHSVVRLPKNLSHESLQGLNKAWVCGRQLKPTTVEFA